MLAEKIIRTNHRHDMGPDSSDFNDFLKGHGVFLRGGPSASFFFFLYFSTFCRCTPISGTPRGCSHVVCWNVIVGSALHQVKTELKEKVAHLQYKLQEFADLNTPMIEDEVKHAMQEKKDLQELYFKLRFLEYFPLFFQRVGVEAN